MGRIDTHVHVASDDEVTYPRQPRPGIGRDWWRQRGYDSGSVLATIQTAGVAQFVAVQAVGVYGYRNDYVLTAPVEHPEEISAVVAVDLDGPDGPAEIERLGAQPGVVGVRLFAVGPGGAGWIERGVAPAAFEAAGGAGLTVVLTLFSRSIPPLRAAIDHSPAPVVFDHCAFPERVDGRVAPEDPVLALAELPHVSLKVSTHVLREGGGDPAPMVDQLAERFGPGRLLWGSDYPQSEHSSYEELVFLAERAFRHLSAAEVAAVWGENAAPLFGLEEAAGP
jgi:L-fuconolactonase